MAVVAVWSVKGGVGVSSVAAMLAIAQAERAEPTVLVDLCGDVPAVLGIEDADVENAAPGVAEWLGSQEPTADALARIERPARRDVSVLPRGAHSISRLGETQDMTPLLTALHASQRTVIVDCGLMHSTGESPVGEVISGAAMSLLVVRECFLNLRAAQRAPFVPTGVIVLKEPGRQFRRADVESATGAPVVAQIAVDARIAQSIDAGLATARLPRRLVRCLAGVLGNDR